MQQPNVIIGCYAKSMKFFFPTPTNNPGRSKQTSSTTRNGRAAARQMIKAHAATTKGKLKTSTRTTTNASKPNRLRHDQSCGNISEIGLTQKKELSIYLAIDYKASTNIASSFDYSTKFSRIVNPMWATDMYTTHGQDAKVEHYLQPHFMDGYIKKDDYLYITTGYLQFDKTLLDPYDEDSSDEENDVPTPILHQSRHYKYRVNFLVDRQLKQFVDIITMNAVHHTKHEHARVLDVHFIKAQQSDDSSDSDSDVTAASAKRQRV